SSASKPFCSLKLHSAVVNGTTERKETGSPLRLSSSGKFWSFMMIGGRNTSVSKVSLPQNGAGGFPFGMVWPYPNHDLLSCGKCAIHRRVSMYSSLGSQQ